MAPRRQHDRVAELLVLRSKWIEAVAADRRLTPTEARVGIHAMRYLNRDPGNARFGQLWPSVARMAADLGAGIRTVKRAVSRLRTLGYLEQIERGGGVMTTVYRPNLSTPRSVPPAVPVPELSLRGAESGVPLVAPDTEVHRTREKTQRAQARELQVWELIEKAIGKVPFHHWFGKVSIEAIEDNEVILSAPTALARSRIVGEYNVDVLRCWQQVNPTVKRIVVMVRSKHDGRPAL